MSTQNRSFSEPTTTIINKLFQAIIRFDPNEPHTIREHRRYLYLVERLKDEITTPVNAWKDLEPQFESDSSIMSTVDMELGIPPRRNQSRTAPQQYGAVYGEFPEMRPAPPLLQSARQLGFVPSAQYTAKPSSPPGGAARPERRAMTEEQEDEHVNPFSDQNLQQLPSSPSDHLSKKYEKKHVRSRHLEDTDED